MITVLRICQNAFIHDYEVDDQGAYAEFICDTTSDIANLPKDAGTSFGFKPRPGSTALVVESSDIYVLSNARQWRLIDV